MVSRCFGLGELTPCPGVVTHSGKGTTRESHPQKSEGDPCLRLTLHPSLPQAIPRLPGPVWVLSMPHSGPCSTCSLPPRDSKRDGARGCSQCPAQLQHTAGLNMCLSHNSDAQPSPAVHSEEAQEAQKQPQGFAETLAHMLGKQLNHPSLCVREGPTAGLSLDPWLLTPGGLLVQCLLPAEPWAELGAGKAAQRAGGTLRQNPSWPSSPGASATGLTPIPRLLRLGARTRGTEPLAQGEATASVPPQSQGTAPVAPGHSGTSPTRATAPRPVPQPLPPSASLSCPSSPKPGGRDGRGPSSHLCASRTQRGGKFSDFLSSPPKLENQH